MWASEGAPRRKADNIPHRVSVKLILGIETKKQQLEKQQGPNCGESLHCQIKPVSPSVITSSVLSYPCHKPIIISVCYHGTLATNDGMIFTLNDFSVG